MKRGYEFRARVWQSASVVLLCAAFTLTTVACGQVFHQAKHTGPCIVRYFSGATYTMERMNGEVFVMSFYSQTPHLPDGTKLADMIYEDNNRSQYFVKAVLAPGEHLRFPVGQPAAYWCHDPCVIGTQ